MSLSPTKESSPNEVRQYDVGWAALNKLLRKGRSFSGRERNRCFLNLGEGKAFANVSGAVGLDLIDDGRGLALSDWDYDGRVDFWVANRTGPRVRFLHNRIESDGAWIALRLEGAKANRDAVGARVAVHPAGGGRPLVQTLYAGSGYISQSSKWLHFGLGNVSGIDRIEVRWPGGDTESFAGVQPERFHTLTEGAGAAVPLEPPVVDAGAFRESEATPARASGAARVPLVHRPPMPEALTYLAADGDEKRLADHYGKPLLVQLWATWCPNCEAEMVAWKNAASRFREAGTDVLAICVDEPSEDREADLQRAASIARERGHPFALGLANIDLIEHLDILQKTYIGRQSDLPLPSTFLVDAEGRLAAVYKGPVGVETALKDAELALPETSGAAVLANAVPYTGRWMESPRGTAPRAYAVALVEHGLLEPAKTYLRQILPLYVESSSGATPKEEERRTSEFSECHVFLGAIHYDEGQLKEAIHHYEKALEQTPTMRKAREELVRAYRKADDLPNAIAQLEALLADRRNDPENLTQLAEWKKLRGKEEEAVALYRESLELKSQPVAHFGLANLLRIRGETAEAIAHYHAALEDRPGWYLPANNLAWIYATHPDAEIRNGPEAKRLADIAVKATKRRIPHILGTLAAAFAELGDFEAAEEEIAKAIEIAIRGANAELVRSLGEKQAFYRKGMPHRSPELAKPAAE